MKILVHSNLDPGRLRAQYDKVVGKVDDFVGPAHAFPESVLPERRKRRAYLSGVLARNEISRDPDAAWAALDDQFVEADPELDETPDRPGGV